MTSVRRAGLDDLERLVALRQTSQAASYRAWLTESRLAELLDPRAGAAALREHLARPGTVALTAGQGETLTGMAVCLTEAGSDPFLETLHVHPAHRGAGIGSALLRALAAVLLEDGHRTLSVAVLAPSHRGRAFYVGRGARPLIAVPAEWTGGELEEVLMRFDDLTALSA